MRASNKILISLLSFMIIALTLNLVHAQDPEAWEEQDATLVGRISHLEGQLSRYNPDTDDWEVTTREAPFGLDDLLYAEADVKAEVIMPNNTWIRIGGDTRLQLVSLKPDTTELDIAFGKARLYNKSAKTQIKATTPFGHITAPPKSTVDLSVDENGVEIIAIRKKVYFVQNTSSDKHVIRSDSSAVYADINEVTTAPGKVEYAWKKWNQEMDALWATRMRDNGASATHLPAELHTEAYPLDRHGVWERVYYDGAHYRFWRPVHVSAGWAPFTSGTWTVWHGEHVWIPHEPFGYVTHHYGNWIFTAGFWYWAPPVTRVMIHTHRHHLRIGFGWYPGRVAWIHHGAHLGWIPLAPREPYYTHRHWGRRSIAITKAARYRHRAHKYRHHKHAVVIHRSHLYRSGNYKRARIKSIPHNTIRKNFRTTPVLNASVIKDHGSLRKEKNRFRPAHRSHISKPSVKSLSANQRGRHSRAISRERRPQHREKVKVERQREKYQPGRKPIDRKRNLSDKQKPDDSKTYTKKRPDRKTTSKAIGGRSPDRQSVAPGKTTQHRKRENIKKNVNSVPSKANPQRFRSGLRDADKKQSPRMQPEPMRTNGIKENRNHKKNGRGQNQQRIGQFAPAQSSKKRHLYQSAHSKAKATSAGRPASYNHRPASRSDTDTSVKRFGRGNQPNQRQLRQPNYRSQGRNSNSFNGTRHRQSTASGSRQRNRY